MRSDCRTHDIHRFVRCKTNKNVSKRHSTPLTSPPFIKHLVCTNAPNRFTYTHKILFGLLFSCIGDALLNHNYFPHGMGSFAIAQLFYINAFGFRPLKLWIGLLLYAGGVASKCEFVSHYSSRMIKQFNYRFVAVYALHENLEPTILIGLPIYTMLLVTMCWRAVAQLYLPKV